MELNKRPRPSLGRIHCDLSQYTLSNKALMYRATIFILEPWALRPGTRKTTFTGCCAAQSRLGCRAMIFTRDSCIARFDLNPAPYATLRVEQRHEDGVDLNIQTP